MSRLRGRRPVSYAVTTMIVLLGLELALIVSAFLATNLFLGPIVAAALRSETAQVSTYFVHGDPDAGGVAAWVRQTGAGAGAGEYGEGWVGVLDRRGAVIAAVGARAPHPGAPLATQLSPATSADLRRVLSGGARGGLWTREPSGSLVVIVPVEGPGGGTEGALVQRIDSTVPANLYWLRFYSFSVLLPSVPVIALVGAGVGGVFGSRDARRARRRFARLAQAVDGWSRGDFSTRVQDREEDEVGRLSRGLDRMAEQLQDLLRTRQELATLEERNRLARDLHDSVKQQVFAASMEVSAARALLEGPEPRAAMMPLAETEQLVRQAQGELTSLIRQLRPVGLENRTLALALRDHVAAWSQQTAIAATTTTTLDPGDQLPADVEEALFRVAQEALANVARHSGASAVSVRLAADDGRMVLSVRDDGRGVDLAAATGGVGLRSMRERSEAVGGTFRIESEPCRGTTVSVSVGRTWTT